MNRETAKWALVTAGCLLVPIMCLGGLLIGLVGLEEGFRLDAAAHRPKYLDEPEIDLHYGLCHFKRYNGKICMANLVTTDDGPWLWLSETEGFKVERKDALENGKRIAKNLELRVSKRADNSVVVNNNDEWAVTLETIESRNQRSDGWLNAGYTACPIAVSLTKDGPRLSMPCTEEEMRRVLGAPDRTVRKKSLAVPGV
jgi:hypothetical protein